MKIQHTLFHSWLVMVIGVGVALAESPPVKVVAPLPSDFKLSVVRVTLEEWPPFGWGERLIIEVSGKGSATLQRINYDPKSGSHTLVYSARRAVNVADLKSLLEVFYNSGFQALPDHLDAFTSLDASPDGRMSTSLVVPTEQLATIITLRIGNYTKRVADSTHVNPTVTAVTSQIKSLFPEAIND